MKIDIGNTLKKEREKQGLTLEDVAKKTLIRQYYLEQIENNEFNYYDGFINAYIRKYAEALGIDAGPLVAQYKSLFEEKKEEKVKENPNRKWIIIVSLSIIAIVVISFFLIKSKKHSQNNKTTPTNITEPAHKKPVTSPSVPEESKSPPKNVEEKKISGVNVTVRADSLCWVGVTIDGRYSQMFLHKGESKVFKGNKYVKIRFGNATHAYVSVNGKDLGVVSKDKKVVEVVYKP